MNGLIAADALIKINKFNEKWTNKYYCNLSSSFVVVTFSSASFICSSKLFILVSKTSGVSAPKIMDDNPLNENPPDFGGVWPLSMACYSTDKQKKQQIIKIHLVLPSLNLHVDISLFAFFPCLRDIILNLDLKNLIHWWSTGSFSEICVVSVWFLLSFELSYESNNQTKYPEKRERVEGVAPLAPPLNPSVVYWITGNK